MIPRAKILTKRKKVEILLLGDMHIGHEDFDSEKFEKYLKWLNRGANRYVLAMGDYVEAAIPTHMPQTTFTQEICPEEQVDWVIKTLKEPARDGKIIGMIEGNHENRIYNKTSFRPLKIITDSLGIPEADLGSGGYFRLQVNDTTFTFTLLHGYGSSQSPGFHLRKAISSGYADDADVLAMGHLHRLYYEIYERERLTEYDKSYIHRIIGIRTGGFLKSPEYAKVRLMPKINTGAPVIVLYPKNKIISPNISDYIGRST